MATVARRTTTTSMLHHSAAARSRPAPRPGATAPAGAGGREPPHFPRAPNPLERGPMAPDGDERVKIVVYYAVWATACALAAAAALAAGQGAVALVTGRILVRLGRTLRATVLLGLLIGSFDFAMYFVQMALPATELGWTPDVIILAAAAALVTVLGSRSSAAAP